MLLLRSSILFVLILVGVIYFSPFVSAEEPLDTWISTKSLPYSLASHTSIVFNNKIYIVSGSAQTGNSKYEVLYSTLDEDGLISSWLYNNPTLPLPMIFHSSSMYKENLYVIGGFQENSTHPIGPLNTVIRGKIGTNGNISEWNYLIPLPQQRARGNSLTVKNRLYYAGGYDLVGSSPVVRKDIYVADINEDGTIGNWSNAGELPEAITGFGMVEHNSKLYVVGGGNASSFPTTDKVYSAVINDDGTISDWEEQEPIYTKLSRLHVTKVGNTLLIIGGLNTALQAEKKVYYAQINEDGDITEWTESEHELPKPICCGSLASTGEYLYLSGGLGGEYLNSVYYTKINNTDTAPTVPLLMQTDDQWGSDIYDTANKWSPSDPSISAWGCGITSAAMVFNYHGLTKMPDGDDLNPGTVNMWLNSQKDGYVGNGYVNWIALARLSKEAKNQNPSFEYEALEYEKIAAYDPNTLTEDLENNRPGILRVPGHFVVATGKNDTTFTINDPYYVDRTDLSSYDNTFSTLGRYSPSNTDLSYIMLVSEDNITFDLENAFGENVGDSFVETPISNANDPNQKNGEPMNMLYAAKPGSGNYTIKIETDSPSDSYSFKTYLYDVNGEVKILEFNGVVGSGSDDTFLLQYNTESLDEIYIQEVVDFDTLIQDINIMYSLKFITNKGTYNELLHHALQAKKFYNKNKFVSRTHLTLIQRKLNLRKAKHVKPFAYEVLNRDIDYLLLIF